MQKEDFVLTKKRNDNENLKSYAARLSRMATSLALKCSVSKPLLEDLEKALLKLDLQADTSQKMNVMLFQLSLLWIF
jgi:hypothetical protein